MTEQGPFLKIIRLRLKKTQEQVSNALGFKNGQHVCNIESGKSPLGLKIANKLIKTGYTTKKEIGSVLISDYMRRVNTELDGPPLWKSE